MNMEEAYTYVMDFRNHKVRKACKEYTGAVAMLENGYGIGSRAKDGVMRGVGLGQGVRDIGWYSFIEKEYTIYNPTEPDDEKWLDLLEDTIEGHK